MWKIIISHPITRKDCFCTLTKVRSHATVAKAASISPDDEGGDIPPPRPRAIDLARKIRQENKRTEQDQRKTTASTRGEKGVSDLKQLSQQLQNVHPNVLAKHLHNTVLFQNDDLVVINKPYGVPVQDNSGGTSISSVLPVLSKMLYGMKSTLTLYPCLSLEKEATGTLLLAKSEEMVDHILALSRNSQVQRKYWVITVGVPVPSEGVIDIPVIEREVTGSRPHFKMGLSPVYRVSDTGEGVTRVRSHRQAQGAVTQYRVLESDGGCSLVELQPLTGVKHQMRVHMALALACPTLGDHKYSHWTKLAPQKLPEGVLGRLGLEQSKVRYLPLHLHARQTILLGNEGQADISVTCPLPRFFNKSLRQLRLNLSSKELK